MNDRKTDGIVLASNESGGTGFNLSGETPDTLPEKHGRKRRFDTRLRFHVTEEERREIDRRAAAEGISRSEYIRRKLVASKVTPTPRIDYAPLIREMNSVGQKLNDLLMASYRTGFLDIPKLNGILQENEQVQEHIVSALGEGRNSHE